MAHARKSPEGMSKEHGKGSCGEVMVLDRRASHPTGGEHRSNGTRGLSTARAMLRVLSFMAQHPERLSRALGELFARTHRRSYLAQVQAGAIVITAVSGRQGIPRVPGLGPRIGRRAHRLALGKVVLSLLPEHGRRRYIGGGLRSYSPRAITSPRALISELDQVRHRGFAIDRGEFDADYCTLAAT
jgi:DNA-binding IclR family transcriptional regulator